MHRLIVIIFRHNFSRKNNPKKWNLDALLFIILGVKSYRGDRHSGRRPNLNKKKTWVTPVTIAGVFFIMFNIFLVNLNTMPNTGFWKKNLGFYETLKHAKDEPEVVYSASS